MKKSEAFLLKALVSPAILFCGLLPRCIEYFLFKKDALIITFTILLSLLALTYLFVRGRTAIEYGAKFKFIVIDSLVALFGVVLAVWMDFTIVMKLLFAIFLIPLFVNNYLVLRKHAKNNRG